MKALQDTQLSCAVEKASERVDGEHEELGRKGVALAEPTSVPNSRTWLSVNKHSGACRREEDGKPVEEPGAEAVSAKGTEQEWPSDRVEGTRQVELQEHAWGAELV